MCGIAGIISLNGLPTEPNALKAMCDTLAHRGPDDAGYAFFHPGRGAAGRGAFWSTFSDPEFRHLNENLPVFGGEYFRREFADHDFKVALGHRRLSILDLSSYGHQPMCTAERRYWIVHNGEIYNYLDLREELEAKGYTFRTRTDTEVILYLWEEYGPDCLSMLDGMFAFAIYDRQENVLTIARDRFGVKPVYYSLASQHFVFASEAKGLFASGLVTASFEPGQLIEYLTFQNTYGRRTIWKDVEILQPGEFLTLRPGSSAPPRIARYHSFAEVASSDPISDEEAVSRVASAFGHAVRRQLVSDVTVGSYLSGGMDSGSIVAVAGQSIHRLHTFTGGFDLTNVNGIEQGFDERELAEKLSYLLQTEHYSVVLHAGDMPAAMDRITWHMDDPRVGMCHQNWYVAKLASRFVKVCLAGTGGDELFAGYPWRYRPAFTSPDAHSFDDETFSSWHRLLAPSEMTQLFSGDLRDYLSRPRASFDAIMREAPTWRGDSTTVDNLLHRALFFEFRTFLHGLLVTDDHISMAHSLETRVPFLDNALADLAWRLAPSQKIRVQGMLKADQDAFIDSADGKHILRRAMENYLPQEFLYQKKQGFSPPDENWYRGPSVDYIKSILFDRRTRERPWFDHDFIESKLIEHFEGKRNHRLLIWSLLSLEWVQRHYIDAARPVRQEQPARLHHAS